jgi:hypothetical protein
MVENEGKLTGEQKLAKHNQPVLDRLCICIFCLGVTLLLGFAAGFGFA